MDELFQKRGFNHRKFTLLTDRLKIENNEKGKTFRYEVKLDQVGFEKQYYATNTGFIKYVIGFFIIIDILLFVLYVQGEIANLGSFIFTLSVFTILPLLFYFGFKPQDDLFLTGGSTNVVFYRNVPNEEQVLDFAEKVITASKNYIKEKYTAFDSTTDEQTYYATLKNLRNAEIITAEEHREYKSYFDLCRLI